MSARRSAVIGVMLVGLTFALLTLAGTTPEGIGRPVDDPPRVRLDERVFTCTGGISKTTVSSGDLRDGLDRTRSVAGEPLRVVAGRDVARGAFAGQQVLDRTSLAWVPCPEPHASWWFAGAGGAAVTHDTVLTIANPRPGAAVIDVDVYGTDGLVDAPGLHGITIAGRTTRVIDLARAAPTDGNVAVSVNATRGLVAVTAADRFAPGAIGRSVREWLPAQPDPGKTLVLAGFGPGLGTSALSLVNPGTTEAIANLEVIGKTGTFAPKGSEPVTVPPQSIVTVPVSEVLDGSAMALRITSSAPVTGTVRTTKNGDTAFATGVQPLRDSSTFAVPQGSGRLVLSSLGKAGTVTVTGFDGNGRQQLDQRVTVKAGTSAGITLAKGIRFLRVVADAPTVVAGFTVTAGKGIAAAGVAPAIRSTRLPSVRPGW